MNLALDGAVEVSGVAGDADSGITKIEVVVDGRDTGDAMLKRRRESVTFHHEVVPPDGKHTVVVRAFDRAGNTAKVTRIVVVTSPGNYIPNPDLNPEASASVTRDIVSATDSTLTLDTAVSPTNVGEILSVGVTSATPQGALRRVVGVRHSGAHVILDTVTATLVEAFNELHIDTTIVREPSGPTRLLQAPPQTPIPSPSTVVPLMNVQLTNSLDLELCSGALDGAGSRTPPQVKPCPPEVDDEVTVEVAVEQTVTIEANVQVHIDIYAENWWELPTVHEVSFALDGKQSATASLDLSGAFAVDPLDLSGAARELIEKRMPSIKLPPVAVPAGPVVLLFSTSIDAELSNTWTVEAGLHLKTELALSQRLGVRYTKTGGWQPIAEAALSKSVDVSGSFAGEVALKGEVEVGVELYGTAGPFVSASITPRVRGTVETGKSPHIAASVDFEAGAGFKVDALGFELASWGKPDLLQRTWEIWQSDEQPESGGSDDGSPSPAPSTVSLTLDGPSVPVQTANNEIAATIQVTRPGRILLSLHTAADVDDGSTTLAPDYTVRFGVAGPGSAVVYSYYDRRSVSFDASEPGLYTVTFATAHPVSGELSGTEHIPHLDPSGEVAMPNSANPWWSAVAIPVTEGDDVAVTLHTDDPRGLPNAWEFRGMAKFSLVRGGTNLGSEFWRGKGEFVDRYTADQTGTVYLHVYPLDRALHISVKIRRAQFPLPVQHHPVSAAPESGYTLAAASDGSVFGWGLNAFGIIGPVAADMHPAPEPIAVSKVASLAAGRNHALAVDESGALYAWGHGGFDELGRPDYRYASQRLPGLVPVTDVVQAAAGYGFSVALTSDGTVYTWGRGVPQVSAATTPTAVPLPFRAVAVAAGSRTVYAISETGEVYLWGGHPDVAEYFSTEPGIGPVPITGVSDAVKIDVDRNRLVILANDGTVYGLSAGDALHPRSSFSVVVQSTSPRFIDVAACQDSTLGLTESGAVYGWGQNRDGSLAHLGEQQNFFVPSPQEILPATEGATAVECGSDHGLAPLRDGAIRVWGQNNRGQAGVGVSDNDPAVRTSLARWK